MKNALIILVLVAVVFYLYGAFIQDKNTATKGDLDEVRTELRQKIDSVMRECDTLKAELRAVRANTDTLKAGQEVIFRTMQENQGKETSLWDLIWR